jgi:cyclophilin family peptidyl-prolyl cis-trans isomerase
VVFGQVVEGYEVVRAIESVGSRTGETAYDVMIASCGELPRTGVCRAPQPRVL